MVWTEDAIRKLADENPDGFTVDVKTGKKVTKGVAVGMTHGLTAFDAAVLANVYQESDTNTQFSHRTVGGWKDGEKYIIDLGVTTQTIDAAVEFGTAYRQDAVFDLNINECIYLKNGA